jgi:phosphoadenosine phosphosulfate reductase
LLSLQEFQSKSAAELVLWAVGTYGARFAIATSFQKESMVLIDLAAQSGQPFRVFTLDTGRLPAETLPMTDRVRSRWGVEVEVVTPDAEEVARMVGKHGEHLFYDGVELRKLCCEIRKVRPLQRKLREFDAWATGMRRDHSEARAQIAKAELREGKVKLNPLADWTDEQIEDYIRRNDLPVHPLYARGYTSIGCDPCTRPVRQGEDPRAGRWWWEIDGKKECGIHA